MIKNHVISILRLLSIVIGILLSTSNIWRIYNLPIDIVSFFFVVSGGLPIFKEALLTIRKRKINTEVSMSIAIVATMIISEFTSSLIITFFALLAEYIEHLTLERGKRAIDSLLKTIPQKVLVQRDEIEKLVFASELRLSDIIIARLGEAIAVDGEIIKGRSFINQSSITGESQPVDKHVGDIVYAGTINQSSVIFIKPHTIGQQTILGKIIQTVHRAQKKHAPIETIADVLATRLVLAAFLFATLTFLFTKNVKDTISVIVVAGACGVALGTPLAILASIGRAAKNNIIVKGGNYIELLSKITTLVFDKTGTLTLGEPEVTDIYTFSRTRKETVLKYAAILERHSTHPIAKAILKKATGLKLDIPHGENLKTIVGKGLIGNYKNLPLLVGNLHFLKKYISIPPSVISYIAQKESLGKTLILVGFDSKLIGAISISDNIRAHTKHAITLVQKMGIQTMLITGDNKKTAAQVAQKLGIHQFKAELLPQDKLHIIRQLKGRGEIICMVGDGINDAPALSEAHIGVAMGSGTDISIEAADIVLATNDPKKIVESIKIGREAKQIIIHNFVGTILVDAIGILLAMAGFLNPLLATFIHTFSEVIFILNSARLFAKK